MNFSVEADPIERIEGTISSILYKHKDSYTLKLTTENNEIITVIIDYGQVLGPRLIESESLDIEGVFEHSMNYGDQLKSTSIKRRPLNEAHLIVQWIAKNKEVEGVGVQTGKKLLNSYGDELGEVLSNGDIETICENSSISPIKIINIVEKWKQYKNKLSAIKYLTDKAFPYRLAMNSISAWGIHCEDFIESNPYNLISFLSFKRLDRFVRERWSIDKFDDRRLLACVEDILIEKYHRTGDTVEDCKSVFKKVKDRLQYVIETLPGDQRDIISIEGGYLQAAGPFVMERYVERRLNDICFHKNSFRRGFNDNYFKQFTSQLDFSLNEKQIDAVRCAVSHPICLIRGGVGTGKTTIIQAIISQYNATSRDILLLAPTGKAALRMSQATNMKAQTVCKFVSDVLKSQGNANYHNAVVIVDESSMIDLVTIYKLLSHLPESINLILVGDERQLPPVGAGLFFHALIKQEWIASVILLKTERQSESSGIPFIASEILNYQVPNFSPMKKIIVSGCVYREESNKCKALENGAKLYHLISTNLEAIKHSDVQLIAGTRDGVRTLNIAVQKLVNPHSKSTLKQRIKQSEDYYFSASDKVIYNENDYTRGLTNGATGTVIDVYPDCKMIANKGSVSKVVMKVRFDDLAKDELTPGENDIYISQDDFLGEKISLAYAITAHKSQGSQYDSAIIILDSVDLANNAWIYTALTRAKNACYIIGAKNILAKAVTTVSEASKRRIGVKYEQLQS
jgi:exodeoxyribonuclease V alpha subunit